MTNNMALSGLWENVIPTNIILTTDGTIGCEKRNTWCQMVLGGLRDNTYKRIHPTGAGPQKSIGYPKYTNSASPTDP